MGRPGRPPKPASERRSKLPVRFTPGEWEQPSSKAERGTGLRDWNRQRVRLRDPMRPPLPRQCVRIVGVWKRSELRFLPLRSSGRRIGGVGERKGPAAVQAAPARFTRVVSKNLERAASKALGKGVNLAVGAIAPPPVKIVLAVGRVAAKVARKSRARDRGLLMPSDD